MNALQEQTVSVLRDLIAADHDGQQGFRTASDSVANDPELKMLLSSFSLQCSKFAGELKNQLLSMGEQYPERESGSFSGAMRRGWLNLKAAVGGFDNRSIIAECETELDSFLAEYNKALSHDLPDSIREVVQRHRDELITTHDTIRALRDSMPAKSVTDLGGEAVRTVRQTGERAVAGAAEVWGEMKAKADEARRTSESYVQRNPLAYLGGALLLGFGVGMLFYSLELRNDRLQLEMTRRPMRRIGTALVGWLGFLAGRAKSGYRSSIEQVQDIANQAPTRLFPRRNRFSRPLRSAWKKMAG